MLSIVIVNWNGEKYLEPCLDSIKAQKNIGYKIYIVDNGSKDRSLEIISRYQKSMDIVLLPLKKNEGFAEANNIGIEASLGDEHEYVLTLNNDLELKENCFLELERYITSHAHIDSFQILLMNYFERNLIDAMGIYFKEDYQVVQLAYKENYENLKDFEHQVMGVSAGAAVYSKKALISVRDREGFFDRSFFAYYEDADLAIRLLKKGYKTALVKDAVAYHVHSGTGIQDSPFKTYYLARNMLLLQYKNRDVSGYGKKKFRFILYHVKLSLKYVARGKFSHAASLWKALLDFYKMKSRYADLKSVQGDNLLDERRGV